MDMIRNARNYDKTKYGKDSGNVELYAKPRSAVTLKRVDKKAFAPQVAWLKAHGFITLEDRVKHRKNTQYVQTLPRERIVIVKLKARGYTTSMLAQVLHRSTSFIHRELIRHQKQLNAYCTLHGTNIVNGVAWTRAKMIAIGSPWHDERKMPNRIKAYARVQRRKEWYRWGSGWLSFLRGEVDKPP